MKSLHFDGAVSVLYFLSGPFKPVSLDGLNTVANKIQSRYSLEAIIILGCRLNEEMSLEHICLHILAALPQFQYKNSGNEAGAAAWRARKEDEVPDENSQFPLSLFETRAYLRVYIRGAGGVGHQPPLYRRVKNIKR